MLKVMFMGIGNFDRQDDGVAWHVLCGIATELGRIPPAHPYEEAFTPEGAYPHLTFSMQLVPEMAELLAEYDQVCFVDAHTGAIPQELQAISIEPAFESSPLTHHMTPQALLALVKTVYKRCPLAILLSIRGYEFQFRQGLSPRTQVLAGEAVQTAMKWLGKAIESPE